MKNKKDNFKNHTLFKALKKWLSEMQENVNEIGQETALAKELLFYIPIGTALIFFYFTNNLSYMYHSFGNYGFEENFLTQIVPLVKAFQHGDLSGARLGIAGPLYPVILAAYNTLFGGDILKGALFINVLSGTAALLLFFFFLKRLAGSPTALISIVLLAVNPLFFEFTYTASSAPLLLFYTLAASLLFLRAFENGKGAVSLALAALFSTLAVLTNISTIILPIFGLALLIRTARYRQAAVFTAALLLFLIPAAIFISAVTPRL
ncbi:MAG: glycosyltransferase family 39 protein, partial [Fibrobacteres bacterium]|nr:glycosyltransferase family 39 protein [Fibrobacterota bacterium]